MKKKQFISSIMICATILAGFEAMPISCVMAAEQEQNNVIDCEENIGSITDNIEKYEHIEKKVEDEVQDIKFGGEHEEIEEFLNENGVFDEEIEELGLDRKFEEIQEKGTDNVLVQTGYYAVDDSYDDVAINDINQNITDENLTADMIKLNQDEVERYIADEYYGEDTGILEEIGLKFKEEKEKNERNSFLEAIGLKPVDAYASIEASGGGKASLLKKTVIVIKQDSQYAKVSVYFEWTKMPVYRNLDSIGIIIDGAQYPLYESGAKYKNVNAVHKVVSNLQEGYVGCPGRKIQEEEVLKKSTSRLKKDEYYAGSHLIQAAIELHVDENRLMSDGNVYNKKIMNEEVMLEFYVKLDNINQHMIVIKPSYIHVKNTRNACNLISTCISILNADNISATYYFASGAIKKDITKVYAGTEKINFEMIVSYK